MRLNVDLVKERVIETFDSVEGEGDEDNAVNIRWFVAFRRISAHYLYISIWMKAYIWMKA